MTAYDLLPEAILDLVIEGRHAEAEALAALVDDADAVAELLAEVWDDDPPAEGFSGTTFADQPRGPGPPGPPPRPGLVWKPTTQRWIRRNVQPAKPEASSGAGDRQQSPHGVPPKGKAAQPTPSGKAVQPPVKGNAAQPQAKEDAAQPQAKGKAGQPPAKGNAVAAKDKKASQEEWDQARETARIAIAAAPVPTIEQVRKVRAKLAAWKAACKDAKLNGTPAPKLRQFYDARGGGVAHKARAKRIFEAHGGNEKGYVVCHGSGQKLHWSDDPAVNPQGYTKFEQGKIFVASQGGDYRDANVLPEFPDFNRSRNNDPVRLENTGDIDIHMSEDAPDATARGPWVAKSWATAVRWIGSALPEDKRHEYAYHLSHVLTRMPAGVRAAAEEAIGKGGAHFYPDAKSVEAAARAVTGKAEAGIVGFVHYGPGGGVSLHAGGGPDPAGTYAHLLWHAVDGDGYYSDRPEWHNAYQRDIVKGRIMLSQHALVSPREGFAEFGRAIHSQGSNSIGWTHPACWAFLTSQGLL